MLDGCVPEPGTGSNLGRLLVGAAALAQKAARLIEAAWERYEEQEYQKRKVANYSNFNKEPINQNVDRLSEIDEL